jgi:hypothetical protein
MPDTKEDFVDCFTPLEWESTVSKRRNGDKDRNNLLKREENRKNLHFRLKKDGAISCEPERGHSLVSPVDGGRKVLTVSTLSQTRKAIRRTSENACRLEFTRVSVRFIRRTSTNACRLEFSSE